MIRNISLKLRKALVFIMILIVTAAVLFFSFSCVSITLGQAGGVVAVSFDKRQIKKVDKIVIESGEESVSISDGELFESLKNELSVAKQTDLNVSFSSSPRVIKFYAEDRLVREMKMGGTGYEQWVKVYEGGKGHIILFSNDKNGLVKLSDETYSKLSRLIID